MPKNNVKVLKKNIIKMLKNTKRILKIHTNNKKYYQNAKIPEVC